ncbi:hypothetical protein J6590_035787 [Homalodisca vitripennis]|nr:hypothetical protein J6590_035787 [Homalodisca vitripennis]
MSAFRTVKDIMKGRKEKRCHSLKSSSQVTCSERHYETHTPHTPFQSAFSVHR